MISFTSASASSRWSFSEFASFLLIGSTTAAYVALWTTLLDAPAITAARVAAKRGNAPINARQSQSWELISLGPGGGAGAAAISWGSRRGLLAGPDRAIELSRPHPPHLARAPATCR